MLFSTKIGSADISKHLHLVNSANALIGKLFGLKIVTFFSTILNMCFRYSKELSGRDDSFEYPRHMFQSREKNVNYFNYAQNFCVRGNGIHVGHKSKFMSRLTGTHVQV